jgi:transcriptional regulator with XRE-family HTH domain
MAVLMKLRLFRVEKGMTIEQFADAIGHERKHYSTIEKGITKPSTRLIEGLCNAFGMTPDEAWKIVKNY